MELPFNFEQWTVEETCQYLEKERLGQWADKFKEHNITGDKLRGLTVANLKGMGIEQLDDCEKILLCIGKLWQIPGKVFNDPIHGHIELHPLLIKIIDTPEFQRLRYIKQLGGVYFVYPGASHNRFEHSIGVAHLAGKLVQSLSARQPELGITHRDILCVQIAGLCHDLGHGPFSHMFDSMFIPKVDPKTEWKHEKASCLMFDHLVEHNGLEPEMEKYGLVPSEDKLFIKEMIVGPLEKNTAQDQEWPYEGRGKEKSFLYEIVANKRNGIDVDKFDYFARDCYHLGVKNNFDYHRFLKFARVCDVDTEVKGENKEERKGKKAKDKVKGEKKFEKQICIRDKEVYNLYNMFHTRYCIHRTACQHRVSSIIQTMIADAFVKADKYIKFEGSRGKTFTLSKAIDDMGAYIKVTDCVFEQILNSPSKELKRKRDESEEMGEARKILHRIITRDLYQCLGEIGIKLSTPKEGICDDLKTELTQQIPGNDEAVSSTHGKICEILKNNLTERLLKGLKQEDFEVVPISMDYGMEYEDPIEKVHFYSKDKPNKGFKKQRKQVSNVLPTYFSDELIRVYYKGTNGTKAAKEYFEKCWEELQNEVRSHRCNNSDRICISNIYLIKCAPVPDEAAPGPSTE